MSSLAFIVLTYYDLRYLNPCCKKALENYADYVAETEAAGDDGAGDDLLGEHEWLLEHGDCGENEPPCYEYYHNNRMPEYFDYFDTPVCVIYAVHYFLNLYIAQNRCQFFVTSYNLMQLFLVIIPPIVLPWSSRSKFSLICLAISRLIRLEKAMKLMTVFINTKESEVATQVYDIATSLFINIYFSAGVFMVLENFHREEQLEYFTAFYATIVTITTVGYGDITPTEKYAQIFFAFLIPYVVFYLLTIQLMKLSHLMNLKSPYQRAVYKMNPEISHIVISGEIQLHALQTFVEELFHVDHGNQERHAIILQDVEPNSQIEMLLHDPKYQHLIKYLQGSSCMSQADMGRAALEASKTCIILTNKNAVDPVTIDHKNILQGLAMKKYVQDTAQSKLRLCMQLIKSDSKQHYMSSMGQHGATNDDQLIIVEEVKMALLAKSCFAPGIISFISNLIMSSGEDEDGEEEEVEEQWVTEYVQGMDHEIYRCRLSTMLVGRYFSELVRLIYKKLRAIVFAIEVNCNQRTIIRLNPADFLVNNIEDNLIHVYCICPSPNTAELIETLEMTRDQYNRYHA